MLCANLHKSLKKEVKIKLLYNICLKFVFMSCPADFKCDSPHWDFKFLFPIAKKFNGEEIEKKSTKLQAGALLVSALMFAVLWQPITLIIYL